MTSGIAEILKGQGWDVGLEALRAVDRHGIDERALELARARVPGAVGEGTPPPAPTASPI